MKTREKGLVKSFVIRIFNYQPQGGHRDMNPTRNPTASLICFNSSQAEPAYWIQKDCMWDIWGTTGNRIMVHRVEEMWPPQLRMSTNVLVQPNLLSHSPHYWMSNTRAVEEDCNKLEKLVDFISDGGQWTCYWILDYKKEAGLKSKRI